MLKHYYEHWLVYTNMNSNVRYSQHDTPMDLCYICIGWPVNSPGCRFSNLWDPPWKAHLVEVVELQKELAAQKVILEETRCGCVFLYFWVPIFPNFRWLYYALQWVIGLILLRSSGNFPSSFFPRLSHQDQEHRFEQLEASSSRRLQTAYLTTATFNTKVASWGWGLVAGWWHKLCPNRKGDFKKNHYFSWGLDGDFHQETHGFHRLMGNSRGDSSFAKIEPSMTWGSNQFTGVWKT